MCSVAWKRQELWTTIHSLPSPVQPPLGRQPPNPISFCKETKFHTHTERERDTQRIREKGRGGEERGGVGSTITKIQKERYPHHTTNKKQTTVLQVLFTKPRFITSTYFDAFSRVTPLRKLPDQIRNRYDIPYGRNSIRKQTCIQNESMRGEKFSQRN